MHVLMRGWKGSLTIEISILLPILFFVFAMVLRESIGFYEKTVNREISEFVSDVDLVGRFYEYQLLKEIGEGGLNEEP